MGNRSLRMFTLTMMSIELVADAAFEMTTLVHCHGGGIYSFVL